MKVVSVKNKSLAINEAVAMLSKALRKNNNQILLLVSGGSALQILNQLDVPEEIVKNITLGLVDERYSKNKNDLNFTGLAQTNFFKFNKELFKQVIDYTIGDKTLNEYTNFIEQQLIDWLNTNPKHTVVTLLGIGPDGHTAGIFPSKKNGFSKSFESKKIVVGYTAPSASIAKQRVTVTISFLLHYVSFCVTFATGKEKGEAISHILTKDTPLHETPARIIDQIPSALITDYQL